MRLDLGSSPLVNKNTHARARHELRLQNYVFDRVAANLRQRTSTSVALLNDLANPLSRSFSPARISHSRRPVSSHCLAAPANHRRAGRQRWARCWSAGQLTSSCFPARHSEVLAVRSKGSLVVLFNRPLGGTLPQLAHWDQLVLNNRHGARLATERLIDQSHRRIASLGAYADSSTCSQQRDAYAQAMQTAVCTAMAHQVRATRLEAAHHTGAPLAAAAGLTAAVCYYDAVALGLLLGLGQRGIGTDRDFTLTGFGDTAEAALGMLRPTTLSTRAARPRAPGDNSGPAAAIGGPPPDHRQVRSGDMRKQLPATLTPTGNPLWP